jgi:dTDP-4-dehydrorhamnose reductase
MAEAMRLLVTGASGLLGGRLAVLLSRSHDVVAARHAAAPPIEAAVPLDLLDPASIDGAIRSARPHAVLHCAALADADRCERDPGLAERLNVGSVESLARSCRRLGLRLVAISTDLVFSGRRAFSSEQETPGPLMVYARTKLLGEQAALAEAPGTAVARVALVTGRGHGPRGSSSEAIAWALAAGRSLRLFSDQYRTPVDGESVAEAVNHLLAGGQAGTFHLGGPERLSRYELGLRVARIFGWPAERLTPIAQADGGLAAPRPADVSLDSGRARRELGWTPRAVDEAIREGRARADIIPPT